MKLVLILLLLQATVPAGEANIKFRERAAGATPVTDKQLRPVKPPDCRTEAEIQRALVQLDNGEYGECFIRDITRLSRR